MQTTDPAELAQFDQALARTNEWVDELIKMFRTAKMLEEEHYALVGLALALRLNVDNEMICEILAAAIKRLSAAGVQDSI